MKRSFTLIEIMISVIILSILILVMNNIIVNLKSTKTFLKNIINKNNQNELLIKTLYYDLLNAQSIKIIHSFDADYDEIYMQTNNSLYHLIEPYVIWYVSKNQNSLMRIESPFKITLPSNKVFFLDKFSNNVKIFKVFNKGMKKFVFIQKADIPIYFEIITKGNLNIFSDKNNTNTTTNANSNNSDNFLPTF